MSSSIERYIGFQMDCQKEVLEYEEEFDIDYFDKFKDKYEAEGWIENNPYDKKIFEELKSLGFIPIHNIDENNKGFFTLITDGMNCMYSWIAYVEKVQWIEFVENVSEKATKELNETIMNTHPLSKDIESKMKRIYELIFEKFKDEVDKKEIKYQILNHYV